jgi:hypothetical protein
VLKPPEIKVIILSTSTKANGFNGYFLTLCNSNPKSKTMKAHFLLLAIACMLLSSCVKEKNTSAACHYDKPLEQIEWLRTVKNDLESSSISYLIYSYNFATITFKSIIVKIVLIADLPSMIVIEK